MTDGQRLQVVGAGGPELIKASKDAFVIPSGALVYEITSGKTGQNYRVSFDQPPSEADVDEAVSYFDNEFARRAGVDPAVLDQSPLGTTFTALKNIGIVASA